jgi:DNA polymerase-3 subunit delta
MKSTRASQSSPSIYLVHGDDDYLVEMRVAAIVSDICDRLGGEPAVESVDCEEVGLEGVVEELVSPSLFSANKVMVLRHFNLSAGNKLAREIDRYLAGGLAPGQYLVIQADKVDKRLKLAKMIDEGGGLFEEKRPEQAGLRTWVAERFRELGKSAAPGVPDLLLDLKGDDLRVLASEIEKTAVYVGDAPKVTEADLQALVGRSRTERIFELLKQVFAGKKGSALETVADLLDAGDTGTRIVGYIGREIRWFVQIKLFLTGRAGLWDEDMTFGEFRQTTLPAFKAWIEASGISESETFLRQKPYAGFNRFKEARRCNLDGLMEMLERLVETNRALVSMSVGNKDRLALETFISAVDARR